MQNVKGGKLGHQAKATLSLGKGAGRIQLQAFILPHDKELTDKMREVLGTERQLRRTQGFYIYRNKRLITYGNWFGLKAQGEFFKLARVKVDIPNALDLKWSLDVKKSVAVPPKQIMVGLRAYVDSVVRQSQHAIRVSAIGKKAKSDDEMQVWNATTLDGMVTSVEINREHPVIKAALASNAGMEKILGLLERTMPIDVIYYSRSGEQKLKNETPLSDEELLEMLKGCLAMIPEGLTRKAAFLAFLQSEPFILHADMLRKHEKEVLDGTI